MAIKVNGTSVITDSRQLANIASLDSTTTATIGAAAGGNTVDLGTTALTSTYSQIDITLPSGYDIHKLYFSLPQPSTDSARMKARFFDSSSVITGSEYSYGTSSAFGYERDYATTSIEITAGIFSDNYTEDHFVGEITIYGARDSSRRTFLTINGGIQGRLSSVNPADINGYGLMNNAEVNSKIRFFPSVGSMTGHSYDFYTLYGIK